MYESLLLHTLCLLSSLISRYSNDGSLSETSTSSQEVRFEEFSPLYFNSHVHRLDVTNIHIKICRINQNIEQTLYLLDHVKGYSKLYVKVAWGTVDCRKGSIVMESWFHIEHRAPGWLRQWEGPKVDVY